MKRTFQSLLLCGIGIICLVGCGQNNADENNEPIVEENQNVTENTETEEDVAEAGDNENRDDTLNAAYDMKSLSDSVFQMDFLLSEQIMQNGQNSFYSPYSIMTALMMLDNGESGQAKEEIELVLAVDNLDAFNESFKAYKETLKDIDVTLQEADSLWLSDELAQTEESQSYEKLLEDYYDSEIRILDFTEEDAADTINSWVSDKTEGMIPQMLSKLPTQTKMVLTDALYFDGGWQIPFVEELTQKQPFYGADGETSVDTMFLYGESYKYQDNDGVLLLELPYGAKENDARFVMDIFMADDENGETDICTWYQALSAADKKELFESIDAIQYRENVDLLTLPKFELDNAVDELNTYLQNMGLLSMYDAGHLTALGEEIAVTDVLHKAKISVDEEGTKAAAVTEIIAAETAMEPSGVEIKIDHPFVFTIRDKEQDIILFTGCIQKL